MLQSYKYYESRAVGVTSEVGLTTVRDLSVLISDECTIRRTSVAQSFLGGPGSGPYPRRVRRLQKYLGPRRHSAKKRGRRRQSINLTPPRRVKAWGDGPLRLKELTVRHGCQTVRWKTSAGSRDLSVLTVLKKHDIFYSSELLEVTRYEPLYSNIKLYQVVRFLFRSLGVLKVMRWMPLLLGPLLWYITLTSDESRGYYLLPEIKSGKWLLETRNAWM